MKIILLQDIPKLGKKGEVKNAAHGYVRNFLMPQKLVEPATPEAIKRHEMLAKQSQTERQTTDDKFRSALDNLAGKIIEIALPANEKGEFYQKVTAKIIARNLEKAEITEEDIVLDEKSIKMIGEYSIPIRRNNITGNILVKITPK